MSDAWGAEVSDLRRLTELVLVSLQGSLRFVMNLREHVMLLEEDQNAWMEFVATIERPKCKMCRLHLSNWHTLTCATCNRVVHPSCMSWALSSQQTRQVVDSVDSDWQCAQCLIEKINQEAKVADRSLPSSTFPEDTACRVCKDGGELLVCGRDCGRCFHAECLKFSDGGECLSDGWACPFCVAVCDKPENTIHTFATASIQIS